MRSFAIQPRMALLALAAFVFVGMAFAAADVASARSASPKDGAADDRLASTGDPLPVRKPALARSRGRVERSETPGGLDLSCPGGKVNRLVDCPEMVCPCQRGKNVVLARSHDPRTGCCNQPSCDQICSQRTKCPRFPCPCGVPGDLAAATDDLTGQCITDQAEVCRRACSD